MVEANVNDAVDSDAAGDPVLHATAGVAMYAPRSESSVVVSFPARNRISDTLLIAAPMADPLFAPFLNLFWLAAGFGP